MAPGSIKVLIAIIVILFVIYIIVRKRHERNNREKNYRSGLRGRYNARR